MKANRNCIIQVKCSDFRIAKCTQKLVDLENKIRNIAAHRIVEVTPNWKGDYMELL